MRRREEAQAGLSDVGLQLMIAFIIDQSLHFLLSNNEYWSGPPNVKQIVSGVHYSAREPTAMLPTGN